MIRSMTAFARTNVATRDGQWVVEMRSLNHRYFEFSAKTPHLFGSLESRVREIVHKEIARGKVTVNISYDSGDDRTKTLSIDDAVAKHYVNSAKKLKKDFGLEGDLLVQDLMRMPGIFSSATQVEDPEKYWQPLKRVVKQTLNQILRAKRLEGEKLAKDIEERLGKIKKSTAKIEKLAEGRTEKVYKKLSERVAILTKDKDVDPDRINREMAILAEKSDVTEEVVRMNSHLDLFSSKIKKKGEVGRELDFLCQEMNREVNTMGSKSQLFEIATEVVSIKGEIEKIREQVQNIE